MGLSLVPYFQNNISSKYSEIQFEWNFENLKEDEKIQIIPVTN